MSPLSVVVLLVAAVSAASESVWRDSAAPIDARVSALLAEMTTEEMTAQTLHLTDCSNLTAYAATSIGACPFCGLECRNSIQAALANTSRLAIPVTFHTESLHGACGGCVVFPMPAGQASTWDVQLVHDIAATIGLEAYATGIDRGFSPELNVPGDARFGRTEESFSEDPCMTGLYGAAAVKGLHAGETGGPSTYLPPFAIVSEAKHFAAYAFGGKDGMAADVSDRTLHEVYLRPWAEYAQAGGRGAMMAHNSVNQVPCHGSAELMGWLRAQGNMSGAFLASDDCDVGLLGPGGFRVSTGLEGSAALAMGAGLDQELCVAGDGRGQAFPLAPEAIKDGILPQAALVRAAGNVLRSKFAAGLFDGRAFVNNSNLGLLNTPAHRALARQAAAEGSILLKNDKNFLPLAVTSATRIAVVGPLAGCASNATFDCIATRSQAGGYTNWGVEVISVLAAAYNESFGSNVVYVPGSAVGGNDTSGFADAISAAAAADCVVFVGGDSAGLGWNKNTCGEDDDRDSLDLPGVQAQLLEAVASAGKPVVAILIHGRPVTFQPSTYAAATAIVAAWRPGCEGGTGLWDVILGRSPPSGRLAQSWVRSVGQIKSQASPWFSLRQGDFDQVAYNGDIISKGYDDGSATWAPAFPFGFGLSYTTWAIDLVSASLVDGGASIAVLVNVTNTGSVASKQVIGAYYSRAVSSFVRHHQRLLMFAKTAAPVEPGATFTLSMTAPRAALAYYDPAGQQMLVEPGSYTITVGPDSVTASGTAEIVV